MKKIYLDYAATTPVRPEVVEAMEPYWTKEFGNPSSLHTWGREARKAVEEAREKTAEVLSASPKEIFFVSSITTANNLAVQGVVRALSAETKPQLVTSAVEHHSVLDIFQHLEKEGFPVTYLPVDGKGIITLEALEKSLKLETVLVSVMWANNEVGTIQPVDKIAAEIQRFKDAKRNLPYFHTDAATVVEYLPIDVKNLRVDLLSLGAHKFGGPKGIAVLYVKTGTKIAPLTFGGHHEESLWPGTEAVPLIVGLAKALEIANRESSTVNRRVTALRDKLIKGILEKIPNVILTGDAVQRLPGIVSFCFRGVEGESILLRLDKEGIAASSGSACTAGDLRPSHVLLAMGIPPETAHGSIRFSLGRETTQKDIDYVLEKLPKIIADLRVMAPSL